jgi:hypothetical protein
MGNIRRRFSTGEDGKTTRVLPPRYRPRNKKKEEEKAAVHILY